jgi:hypothetical protein
VYHQVEFVGYTVFSIVHSLIAFALMVMPRSRSSSMLSITCSTDFIALHGTGQFDKPVSQRRFAVVYMAMMQKLRVFSCFIYG